MAGCARDEPLDHPADLLDFEQNVKFEWSYQNGKVGGGFHVGPYANYRIEWTFYLYDGEKKRPVLSTTSPEDLSRGTMGGFAGYDDVNDAVKLGGWRLWLDYCILDSSDDIVIKGSVISDPGPSYTQILSNPAGRPTANPPESGAAASQPAGFVIGAPEIGDLSKAKTAAGQIAKGVLAPDAQGVVALPAGLAGGAFDGRAYGN